MNLIEGWLPIPNPRSPNRTILGDSRTHWCDYETNILLFTANSYLRKDGDLVMGAGAARLVKENYHLVPQGIGRQITHLSEYNLKWYSIQGHQNTYPAFWLGAFQVKFSFNQPADLQLIKNSCSKLSSVAERRPDHTFHLNFPGIGNGKLKFDHVSPIVADLPNNVNLYVLPRSPLSWAIGE